MKTNESAQTAITKECIEKIESKALELKRTKSGSIKKSEDSKEEEKTEENKGSFSSETLDLTKQGEFNLIVKTAYDDLHDDVPWYIYVVIALVVLIYIVSLFAFN